MFQIIKVSGNSMFPEYKNGDFVVILKSPFFKFFLKKGKDIVFKHRTYGTMIKRIMKIDKEKSLLDLEGINKENTISKIFLKDIKYEDVLGIVILHFK